MRALLLGMVAGVALLLASCATRNPPGLPPAMVGLETPPSLQHHIDRLRQEGERNWVLNLNELAVDAMRQGHRDIAARALDESILYINDVFGTTPQARRARSLFFQEGSKLFKGDPYERSLTFFYRGILYMQEERWDSARAMFRSAIFQDSFAEEQQFANDWAIFEYLIAVCEMQMNRPFFAREAYERASIHYNSFLERQRNIMRIGFPTPTKALPMVEPEHNLIVIVQTGSGPRKHRAGDHGQFLAYRRGTQSAPRAEIEVCGRAGIEPWYTDSVYYQATTRGGRPFDTIQGRKVLFKQATGAAAEAGLWTSLAILSGADNEGRLNAGLIVLGSALLVYTISELTQTKADIRQWSSIPDALGVFPSNACHGEQRLRVRFSASQAAEETVYLPEPGNGTAVVLAFPPPYPALLVPPPPRPRTPLRSGTIAQQTAEQGETSQ